MDKKTQLDEAIEHRKHNRQKQALEILQSLIQSTPNDPDINYQIAWTYDSEGKESEALPFYEKAIANGLKKDRLGAMIGLGSTYRCLGKHEESLKIFDQAMREFPQDRALKVFRALTLFSLGQVEESVSQLLIQLMDTTDAKSIKSYERALRYYSVNLGQIANSTSTNASTIGNDTSKREYSQTKLDGSIGFRLASLNDLEQLVQLRFLMQSEVNDLKNEQVPLNYFNDVREYFKTAFADETYVSAVATARDKIIGTAGVCIYKKPPSITGGTGRVGYVTNVYVIDSFRGQGIGQQLMKELNQLAENMKLDKLHLGTTPDGLSVYRAAGYVEPKYFNLEIRFPAN